MKLLDKEKVLIKVNNQSSMDYKIEDIIKKYSPDIKIMAKKYFLIGGSEEDLFQEGMIGLVQSLSSFDKSKGSYDSDSFKNFALMCAKRQILDAIKKSNSKKNLPLNSSISYNNDELADGEVDSIIKSDTYNPEDIVLDKVQREEEQKYINLLLTDLERQILDLYLSGIKQTEIAKALNKNTKFIDNTLQKIKSKLRNKGRE